MTGLFALDPSAKNIMPARYRQVALRSDMKSLDLDFLERELVGREAYMRTRFIVARSGEGTALVEVAKEDSNTLFAKMRALRILANPEDCIYVVSPETDVGVPSQLAAVAVQHPLKACVIVEGLYSHVSFILNPAALRLTVIDVVPPFPAKLVDQVERVLACAEDLPPIVVSPMVIDSRALISEECDPLPERVLVPCRGSGWDLDGIDIAYLDERPEHAGWTLLGCERSHQIHKWFYGATPETIDICPRRFAGTPAAGAETLSRCCLLQEEIEDGQDAIFVPWGSTLDEVRRALDAVVKRAGVAWTPT